MIDCTAECKNNVCGDGLVLEGKESCDDANDDDFDECRNDCTLTSCGDGEVDGPEECDDGNDVDTDACVNCFYAKCGDGHIYEGVEECDGDTAEGQCEDNCTFPV